MDDWLIERLDASHDREGFSCGKAPLDDFLKTRAGQYERKGVGRTFIAVLPQSKRALGYYTLENYPPLVHEARRWLAELRSG